VEHPLKKQTLIGIAVLILIALGVNGFFRELPNIPGARHRNLGKLSRWIERTEQQTVLIENEVSNSRKPTTRPSEPEVSNAMPKWGSVEKIGNTTTAEFRRAGVAPEIKPSSTDKKRKKKKKAIARKTIRNPVVARPETIGRFRSSTDNLPTTQINFGFNAIQPVLDQPNLLDPKTLKDWKAVVDKGPGFTGVNRLINEYQSKRVADDIFYKVVDELLVSNDSTKRQYGILALGATPSLTSFTRLAKSSSTESQSNNRSALENALLVYREAGYITLLTTALQSGEPPSIAASLEILRGLVEAQIATSTPATTQPTNSRLNRGGPNSPDQETPAQLQPFAQLSNVLRQVDSTKAGAPFQAQIRELYARLEVLINTNGTPRNPVARN
jgi:hypothetical protein